MLPKKFLLWLRGGGFNRLRLKTEGFENPRTKFVFAIISGNPLRFTLFRSSPFKRDSFMF